MKINQLEEELITSLKDNKFDYTKINDPDELKKIHDLFKHDIPGKPVSAIELTYFGIYYTIQNNPENMKICYLKAIEKGESNAMNNLACWYKNQNDVENMKIYYLKAIEKGNSIAMNNLADWYGYQNDPENMKTYYLMSIKKGNTSAMNNLAFWYRNYGDIENMKTYYHLAIEKGNSTSLNNLANWYNDHGEFENIVKIASYNMYTDEFQQLLKKALTNISEFTPDLINSILAIDNCEFQIPLVGLIQKLHQSKIDLIDLHFNYQPNGDGYKKAKEDFVKKLCCKTNHPDLF